MGDLFCDDPDLKNLDLLLSKLENKEGDEKTLHQTSQEKQKLVEIVPAKSQIESTKYADILDSSDEEEMKNFFEQKYSEYGSDINKRLKEEKLIELDLKVSKDIDLVIRKDGQDGKGTMLNNQHETTFQQAYLSRSFKAKPIQANHNRNLSSLPSKIATPFFTDPVFGIRIMKPLISSIVLAERMKGRKAVPFSVISWHIQHGDLSKDWVIAGVIVSKSPVRLSKKGSPFSIWRLTDLRGEIKMVSLFLFNAAHKDLWKTVQGTCIAVLNPTIFEKRADDSDIACFSIDSSQKVMILGESKDLGICKARKKNGDACTSTVNLNECEYCIHHMKQEFNKMSRRSELQSSASGGGLNDLRNKVLGKSEVFYGGHSYTAIPAKKSAKQVKKDVDRLSLLSDYGVSPFSREANHTSKVKSFADIPYVKSERSFSKLAGSVEFSVKQRLKDMERLKILREKSLHESNTKKSDGNQNNDECLSDSNYKYCKSNVNLEFNSYAALTPKLSQTNFNIEIDIGARNTQLAKQKAVELLKKKSIEKLNPNAIRGSREGKRRAIDDLNRNHELNDYKKQKIEEEKHLANKSRIQRIIDATSSHKDLVDVREQEEQDKYFSKLEKKEALEEKMLNTFKMPCKAIICKQCNYTAFSASDLCKKEKHILKIVDAEKRFFKCKDCGNRTVTVFKLPKVSCKNCHSSRWERAAMIRERKICNTTQVLSIRGDEEIFIGGLVSDANLNLCVPED